MKESNVHSIHYIKIKKNNKIDKCNICGEMSELSWDHVPPKGSVFFDSIEIYSIFGNNYNWKSPHIISQNGIKYRTICNNCNNTLGGLYDVSYNEFIKNASKQIYSYNDNKKTIEIEIKPNKVFMSIIGHLLAAKFDYEETVIDELMRKIIFEKKFESVNLNIFYWFYPFPNIGISRDFFRSSIVNKEEPDFFSLLKSYPIGFYVTQKETCGNLRKLNDYFTSDDDEIILIPLNICEIYHPDWPIIVDDENIIIAGQSYQSAVTSKPKTHHFPPHSNGRNEL